MSPHIPRAELAQERCSVTHTETLQDRNTATRRGEYTQHRAIPSTARTGSRTPRCLSKPQPQKAALPLPAPHGPSRCRAPELSNHHLSPDPSAGFIVPSHALLPLSKSFLPASCFAESGPGLSSAPGWVRPPHLPCQSPRQGGR